MTAHRPGTGRGRSQLLRALLVPATLATLGACTATGSVTALDSDATAGPAGVSTAGSTTGQQTSTGTPSASTTTTGSTASSTTSDAATAGCSSAVSPAPDGAGTAQAADLDGDGRTDEVWLAIEDGDRVVGVNFAAGGSASTTFTGAPISATAYGNRLGDGTSIVLVSTGRSAALYSVIDCEIVATRNINDAQYTFDLGFAGYGTGVACPNPDSGLYLAGYNSTQAQDGEYEIIRTRIDLSEDGALAENGTVADLGLFSQSSPTYRIANKVSCGEVEGAVEPAS